MAETACAGIFIRDNGSPHKMGWRLDGDIHNFPHATFLVTGSYRCRRWRKILDADGNQKRGADGTPDWLCIDDAVRSGPCFFPIEAQDKHSFECLEDGGRLLCLYLPRDPLTGEPVAEWNGWLEATH